MSRHPAPNSGLLSAPVARPRRPAAASSRCLLWLRLSGSAICGGIPHLAELVSMYLIILISAWPKLPISLQASSAGALRSLAALIGLPVPPPLRARGQTPSCRHRPDCPTETPRKRLATPMAPRRSHAALAKRGWRALRPALAAARKSRLRKDLPGIDDRNGQGRCNNQAAKHQGGLSVENHGI